jgi:hypothetical protein
MILELMAMASGQQGSRVFNSVPYVGTGAPWSLSSGVDATLGDVAMLMKRPVGDQPVGVFDTVRGISRRVQPAVPNEDIFSSITPVGRGRVFTGSNYNVLGEAYQSWHFAKRAGFLDIVNFTGGDTGVTHALGETPAFVLVFRRGGPGSHPVHWIPGDPTHMAGSAMVAGNAFDSVSSTLFTPSTTPFPVGGSFVAYLFGTGLDRVATGSYVGAMTAGTDDLQDVTLPFAPSWMLLWGPWNTFASAAASAVLDPLMAEPDQTWGTAAFTVLPATLEGSTLHAESRQGVGARSAGVDGLTYRYVVIR